MVCAPSVHGVAPVAGLSGQGKIVDGDDRCRMRRDVASRRPLGRLLVEMGLLDQRQLERLLSDQRREGGLLGEIAVGRGMVSRLSLLAALKRQAQSKPACEPPIGSSQEGWRPVGQILVERGVITEIQLQQALANQSEDGGLLGELLMRLGWINANELTDALQQQLDSTSLEDDVFIVRERHGQTWTELFRDTSFAAATDYIFDQVLLQREPHELSILKRSDRGERTAWSYGKARHHDRDDREAEPDRSRRPRPPLWNRP